MEKSLLLLPVALALVLLNGFFVAAEFALVKVRRTRIRELADDGSLRARVAARLVDRLDAYLSATQLGITFASIALGWIGEPALAHLIEPPMRWVGVTSEATLHGVSFAIAFMVVSFLHIVLGELAPKSLAIRKPEGTALWVAVPLLGFYYALYPLIVLLNGTANALLRLLGIAPADEHAEAHSGGELQMIVAASHAHGLLHPTAGKIIERALRFTERQVVELMVPRTEIVWIDEDTSMEAVRVLVGTSPYSHFPVCKGSMDQLVGVVHIKDLITYGLLTGGDFKVATVAHKPVFVPETMLALKLLDQFRSSHSHVAFVVDEHGAMQGLVTLNDVLSALVGNVSRHGERTAPRAARRGDGSWLLHGRLPMHELIDTLGLTEDVWADLPDVNTVAGLITALLGHIPRKGEHVEWQGYRLEVGDMDGTRVGQVLARRA